MKRRVRGGVKAGWEWWHTAGVSGVLRSELRSPELGQDPALR